MATVIELADAGGPLELIDVFLEPGEQSWRRIYGTTDFVTWLNEVLPNYETTIVGGDSDPLEQLDAVFHEFVLGRRMIVGSNFKSLSWTPDLSVWEFKTPDIRVFGWIPEKDVFICTYGDMKDEIELRNKYGRYQVQTKYFRDQLELNEPKYLSSKVYEDVLSDAC